MKSHQITQKIAEKYPDQPVKSIIKDFIAEMKNCFLQNENVQFLGMFDLKPSFRKGGIFGLFEIPDRWVIYCKTSKPFKKKLTDTLSNSSHDD